MRNVEKNNVPNPCPDQVERYLRAWDELENYHLQENALDKLFFKLCPENTEMSDILLKVAVLNEFYSTNIFSVYSVAKHILSLNIDARLDSGDVTLVQDLQKVTINGVEKNFYSFSTKYCSHHKPLDYPIYDSYVEKVLCYFRDRDKFSNFKKCELKNYEKFKEILGIIYTLAPNQDFSMEQISEKAPDITEICKKDMALARQSHLYWLQALMEIHASVSVS